MSAAVPYVAPSPDAEQSGSSQPAGKEHAAVDREIRIYGHSNMFYWWPVWLAGFVMAGLTYIDGHVLVAVPLGTQIESSAVVPGDNRQHDVLIAPAGKEIPPIRGTLPGDASPGLRVAANNNLGVVFVGILLLVVVVSNYVLRGLVSAMVVATLTAIGLLIALLGWWDAILAWLGGLDIRMNAEGYLAIAIPLFSIWTFTTFIYDHYTYLVVARGQVRIRESIGDGELAVDSGGLLLDKKRNDLFRHWLLGLGAGDLHVKSGGPANIDFELPNVLLIGSKLRRVQDLLREKEVESTAG